MVAHGIDPTVAQSSVSWNARRGTLRGLHLQTEPNGEGKLVRCTRGEIYDVIVDLRHGSATFRAWHAATLSAENHRAVFAPRGVAHGFLTLCDATEVTYQMTTAYAPESASGVRWDDPAFGIEWPFEPALIAARDATFPDFAP